MNRKLIIALISLSVVMSQCHNSCDTCNLNVCLTCAIENSEVDPQQRACVCKQGYYATSLNPLNCDQLLQGQEEDQCEVEIGLNIADFQVNTLCYFSNENDKSYVISDISIDTDHSQFNGNNCRGSLFTKIQYRPKDNNAPKEDDQYIDLPNPNYVSDLPGGKAGEKRIKIPLIDIYNIYYFQKISDDGSQIIQEVHFRILIGFTRKFLRSHRWVMTIYTNRNQVQTFTIDVDIQRTESCQDGQECIIIADLDVTGDQYNQNWVDVKSDHSYTVGDWMYMRIWFKDATYTKQLSFQKLYFKNDQGQVFDQTSLTDSSETKWSSVDKSLHVKLRLIEPSSGAIVQVNMLIETADARLRRLQDNPQTVKQQFQAVVFNPLPSNNASQGNNSSNTLIMFFGLLQFVALMLIY